MSRREREEANTIGENEVREEEKELLWIILSAKE